MGGFFVLVGFIGAIVALIGVIRGRLWFMKTRGHAGIALAIAFVVFALGGAMLPPVESDGSGTIATTTGSVNARDQQPEPNSEPAPEPVATDLGGTNASQTEAQSRTIGVSVAAFRETFESDWMGFVFEESTPVRGQPRVMASAPNGLASLELIGDAENLSQASIIFGVPSDAPDRVLEITAYVLGFVKIGAGEDWADEALDWVTDTLEYAVENDGADISRDGVRLSITPFKSLGMIIVTFQPE